MCVCRCSVETSHIPQESDLHAALLALLSVSLLPVFARSCASVPVLPSMLSLPRLCLCVSESVCECVCLSRCVFFHTRTSVTPYLHLSVYLFVLVSPSEGVFRLSLTRNAATFSLSVCLLSLFLLTSFLPRCILPPRIPTSHTHTFSHSDSFFIACFPQRISFLSDCRSRCCICLSLTRCSFFLFPCNSLDCLAYCCKLYSSFACTTSST